MAATATLLRATTTRACRTQRQPRQPLVAACRPQTQPRQPLAAFRSLSTSAAVRAERENFGLPPVAPKQPPPRPSTTPLQSIILDPKYNPNKVVKRQQQKDEENIDKEADWWLDPFARMAESPMHECAITQIRMPRDFMLNLRPSIDGSTIYLLPDRLQHPSVQPRRTGVGLWIALHPATLSIAAVEVDEPRIGRSVARKPRAAGKDSRHWLQFTRPLLKNLSMVMTSVGGHVTDIKRPQHLVEMVHDGLRQRVVQELDIVRDVVREHPGPRIVVPLSDAAVAEVKQGKAPQPADGGRVIAILDLRTEIQPHDTDPITLLSGPDGEANVPLYPLHELFGHRAYAGQVAAHVRDILATDRQRATETAEQGAMPKGWIADAGKFVEAATDGVESHRSDEEHELVALVVPPAGTGTADRPRDLLVNTAIALWRVALNDGFGWDAEVPEALAALMAESKHVEKGESGAKGG